MMSGFAAGFRVFLRRALVLGRGALADAMAEALSREPDLSVTVASSVELSDSEAVRALVAECNVVLSAAPRPLGAVVLRTSIEAKRLIADAATPVSEALSLHERALEMEVAACVGCDSDGLLRLLGLPEGAPAVRSGGDARGEERLAALMAAALARRLLTGDFRGHWGVWTPERLRARAGMAHGIAQDLRERGLEV